MLGRRRKRTRRQFAGAITVLLSMSLASVSADAAGTETTLYTWPGKQSNPGHSFAGLVADRSGNLYGTASGEYYAKGSVFELSPPTPANPNWTEKVLYIFTGGADGGFPLASLVFGQDGALYGTTTYGGHRVHGSDGGDPFTLGEGVVFQLVPPKSPHGAWVEHVLHAFRRDDTAFPTSGLTPGSHGEYYGVTAGYYHNGHNAYAAIYAVYPPAEKHGTWQEVTLYRFSDYVLRPAGGVIADASGNLYGALGNGGSGHGSIYELSQASASHWIPTELYRFGDFSQGAYPEGALYAGSDGSLYGTTQQGGLPIGSGEGTVYRLVPPATPGGQWQGSVIHAFNQSDGEEPSTGVIGDASGALYGTTSFGGATNPGFGIVFKLTRDGARWHETVLHEFHRVDGTIPNGLLEDGDGKLYGTTGYGTHHGAGNAFSVTP
jgi:uncharacterized repeat protein (TIGR03803 family)